MTSRDQRDDSTTPMPRWVKGFGFAGVVVVVLIVIMLLTGHGPGRHLHGASPDTNPMLRVAAQLAEGAGR